MAENRESNMGGLTVKVDVDVSDALTGLKAVQREAKEATRALKELERVQGVDFSKGDMTKPYNSNRIRVFIFTKEIDPYTVRDEVSKFIPRGQIFHGEGLKHMRIDGFDFRNAIVIRDQGTNIDNSHFNKSIHITFGQWKTLSKLFTTIKE